MFLEDYNCVLCSTNSEESSFHLFFECPFSSDCWNSIGIHWELSMQPLDMIIHARTTFGNHIFREIFITACWMIWNVRNGTIFDNKACLLADWKELGLVCTKAKKSISDPLSLWRENHL
jgi:hypothetical protein